MNTHLQNILNVIQQDKSLTVEEKNAIVKSLKDADKELEITAFKLDRTEKVKRTTAILLEETIEELEQKRKAVESQNRELEIEGALERVRTTAMGMRKADDLLNICQIMFKELQSLGFSELRNALIHTFVDEQNYFIDYDYSDFTGGHITRIPYSDNPLIERFIKEIRKSKDAFTELIVTGIELDEWKEFRKAGGQIDDSRLDKASSLYYYYYSIEAGDIGISTFSPISENQRTVLKRFRNVFDFAYRRYTDIEKAEAQAREAQIELGLERVRAKAMAMQRSDELKELIGTLSTEIGKLDIILDRCFIVTYDIPTMNSTWWMANPETPSEPIGLFIPYHEHIPYLAHIEAWRQRKVSWEYILEGDEKKTWDQFLFVETELSLLPATVIENMRSKEKVYLSSSFNNFGYLTLATLESLTYEQFDIMLRFAKVFDLTYTRFNDLKQAEAQAKEAKIEAALERVRGRSMAMHSPQEIKDVALEMRNQLGLLEQPELEVCAIHLYEESPDYFESWVAIRPPGGEGKIVQMQVQFPKKGIKIVDEMMQQYESGMQDYVLINEGDKVPEWLNVLKETTPEGYKMVVQSFKGRRPEDTRAYWSMADFKGGSLVMTTYVPPGENARKLLRRFANVFGLAYRRFIDLKNAEIQKREAQIELALERVRARTMAMQKSDELAETSLVLFQQFKDLGETSEQISIGIFKEDENIMELYSTLYGSQWKEAAKVDLDEPVVMKKIHTAWKEQKRSLVIDITGKDLRKYNAYRKKLSNLEYKEDRWVIHIAFFSKGVLTFSTTEPHPQETIQLLERFAVVFEQTYTRFLDLQKAEAQAKEAKIEAALERVRAKAMAMHRSNDLHEAVTIMFEEFQKLNINVLRCGVGILDKNSRTGTVWATLLSDNGFAVQTSANESFDTHPLMMLIYEHWQKQEDLSYVLQGQDLINYYRAMEASDLKLPQSQLLTSVQPQFYYAAMFNAGGLYAFTDKPFAREDIKLIKRFASVVNLTYNRFLDLQKAEAQAREAQIEAALERVRARTMGMHKSDELPGAASLLFHQIQILGMPAFAAGYCIWEEEKQAITLWMSSEGVLQPPFKAPTTEDELFIQMRKGYEDGRSLHIVEMGGEELVAHYQYMRTLPVVGDIFDSILEAGHPLPVFQVMHYAYFSKGFLLIITYESVPNAHAIFKRFAAVFDQTYTRFLDLQKAEAQAREARIEASLERVRSKAMAMHSSQDLADTIGVFYHELELFSITPRRCGVGLLNKETRIAELSTMNTTEQGKSIEIIGKIKMEGHPVLEGVYDHWLLQKEYHPVLRGNEIREYYQLLKPQIDFPEYLHDAVQYGYFFFFPEGGVYAWTDKEMGEDELLIYRRFTSVLSLTYKRYKDLQQSEALAMQAEHDLIKLKEEKKKTEDALLELKATQAQLIQSEKMASLGELTAGIAHEIQNPLNFVNNFSEVSTELLDEMIAGLGKDTKEDVITIVNDIKQNLEKILHHGKRADGIVKGMLQHSRMSSAGKEPTDINRLADEYLRLAYHGLRAKDNFFNAAMKTDFDESIGSINVIPQDIGRVILNLITNAFYAVTEKRKLLGDGYEPVVTVSTKRLYSPLEDGGSQIEIRVKDNGSGIPQKDLEKIFQPFFTTKPTGQGTGLGLSLSYDIIKAHRGEIKVETKESEGTEFVIVLPAKD